MRASRIVCLILLETNICVCGCMEYDKMKEEVNVLFLEKDTCIENIEQTEGYEMKYAVSSCLLGVNCKYNGGNNASSELIEYLKEHEVLQVCPEVLGGLPVPRACAELSGDNIMNTEGEDVTAQFEQGAALALAQIREFQPDLVILQPRSPSCGKGIIYDGGFHNRLVEGNGILVRLLLHEGIPVMTCGEFLEEVNTLVW